MSDSADAPSEAGQSPAFGRNPEPDALTTEMSLQGMPWPTDRLPGPGADAVVDPLEVDEIVAAALETPLGLSDGQLWVDWLEFLEGAARNGGLLIQA